MASGSGSGRPAPPKPWERVASTNPSPFTPSANATSTASVVETSVTTTKNETGIATPAMAGTTVGRPMPPRPWEQDYNTGYGTSSLTSYNQGGYGTGYGSGLYGSSYSSPYGRTGMYGGGGYGGSMYGNSYGSSYGGGMYGNRYGLGGGYGGGMGGYGMGGGYGAMGPYNPNGPNGEEPPPRPPGLWLTLLQGLAGAMHFFGRISMLVDENTQALHLFITALLQLFDRSGILYGELARFVLRILGFRSAKSRARSKAAARALEGAGPQQGQHAPPSPGQNMPEKPAAPEREWDSVWKD